jgi:hypothetical protein
MNSSLESTRPPDCGGYTAAALRDAALSTGQWVVVASPVVHIRDEKLQSIDRHRATKEVRQEVRELPETRR